MSAIPVSPIAEPWHLPSRGRVAMLSLITGESAIFTIFVVAYVFYIGKSLTPPYPQQVLEIPIFNTICLLSSSVTIWLAERQIERGKIRGFAAWWALTIALGMIFIVGTGMEWHKLIYLDGLTIRTNLFGTTFYSLVGLHVDFAFYADGACDGETFGADSGVCAVLAFCGRSVGSGFYGGLHRG